jgi:tyrosine-protein phosphatase YwqE
MMFSIFKKKPRLFELIPSGFVDIHSHVLPGLDDGCKNMTQSIELIQEMQKLGFSELIATPHTLTGVWENSSEGIKESWNSLNDNQKLSMPLSYASEYLLDNSFLDRMLKGDLLCLKDQRVLVELSYFQAPINLFEILFELQLKGYIPVLAHPERYNYYFSDFKIFEKLKKAGCLFQLNLMSVVGHYGPETMKMSDRLLDANLIDYVGSDIHHKAHLEAFQRKVQVKNVKALKKAIAANAFFSKKA